MANPQKGEVSFKDSAGKEWTLRYDTNALCELEDDLGKPILEIVQELDKGGASMTLLRTVIWVGLTEHHDGLTKKQAGDLMSDVGVPVITAHLTKAFELAFPAGEAAGAGDPPKG